MGIFSKKNEQEKTVDTTEKVNEGNNENKEMVDAGNVSESVSNSDEYIDIKAVTERKKRLAKRLIDMTEKLDSLSHQIYNLKQRIEVLEKKSGIE